MSLLEYMWAPRVGHLNRFNRVVGYLGKMKHVVIIFRTGTPDYSNNPHTRYDWRKSLDGDVKESLFHNTPDN